MTQDSTPHLSSLDVHGHQLPTPEEGLIEAQRRMARTFRDNERVWLIGTRYDPVLPGWLVDNQDVPAKPAVLVFIGRVYSTPTDAAVQCGAAFDSSIYGSVEDANAHGISGARLRVTSADGRNNYNVTTGRGGVYTVPGLGCTTWTVRLISVPNTPNGFDATVVTVRNLNGGRFTSAEVRFKLRS
jgi:hypothetical protein